MPHRLPKGRLSHPTFSQGGQSPKPEFSLGHLVQASLEVVYFSEGLSWEGPSVQHSAHRHPEVWHALKVIPKSRPSTRPKPLGHGH